MNNLVSNAIKFTHTGRVDISLKLVSETEHYCSIFFEVADTGIGLTDEAQSRVFNTFTQATSSITRQFGGTGLGLSITKQLLNLMGSDIQVDSVFGEGSKFFFTLTFKSCEQNEINPIVRQANEEDLSGRKILIVEDTEFNIFFATQLLEGWNIIIDIAENGKIAVDKATHNKYDLILMDLQMPEMDGYTASLEIRKFDTITPIVALTASASNDVKEKVHAVGMQDYVTKPFNPNELFTRIKKYMK